MKKRILLGAACLCFMGSAAVQASTYFMKVNDMSQLAWQIDNSGVVWLRNLNSFDSSVISGNYNFSLDTTTNAGKSMWAAMLARIETAQSMWIGLSNGNTAAGPVNYVGNW